jgi:hypothetical protein
VTIPLPTSLATAMRINRFFSVILLAFVAASFSAAAPVTGKTYAFKLVDVDGRILTAADHVVTVLVLAARRDLDKARQVGSRIPDRCLGSPKSRMITVIRFDKTRSRTARFFLSALVRRGLDTEAKRLKSRYMAKKLNRDPREDIYAVADFEGQTAEQLGLGADAAQFRVLILSANGVLLRDWSNVPSAQDLSAVLP